MLAARRRPHLGWLVAALIAQVRQSKSGRLSLGCLPLPRTQPSSSSHAAVAVGIEPNTELAVRSGLEIDPSKGGILVNAELEARRDIWAVRFASCPSSVLCSVCLSVSLSLSCCPLSFVSCLHREHGCVMLSASHLNSFVFAMCFVLCACCAPKGR